MSRLIDALIPPRCLACTWAGAEPFCPACAEQLEPDGEVHHLAPDIATVAAFAYEGALATAIKVVKTSGLRAGARGLARLLDLPDGAPITWVPAPPSRQRQRGLDLPEVLAGPRASGLLRRTGRPDEQPDLTREQRLTAQFGTFAATGVIHGPVVLVDDVRATGSTVLAAAQVLLDAGARRVLAVTLAASGGAPSATNGHAANAVRAVGPVVVP